MQVSAKRYVILKSEDVKQLERDMNLLSRSNYDLEGGITVDSNNVFYAVMSRLEAFPRLMVVNEFEDVADNLLVEKHEVWEGLANYGK